MKNIILIPSYEPDNNLLKLVEELSKEKVDIVIVNDGSDNNYDDIFNKCRKYSHVISYQNNKGKGYALKTGIKYIKDTYHNDYVITTMDSDGQHRVIDALKLSEIAMKKKNTLVLGKRIRSKKTPIRSRLGNEITKLVFLLSSGYTIYDTQTGLRSFSDNLVDYMLNIDGERFEYEMNVLLNLKKNKIEVLEEEIETIYIDNNSKSHFNTFKDSYMIYKDIIKFSIASITSFILDYILYVILVITTDNVLISNISARILSATYNYNMNKYVVFKNKKGGKTFIQYFLLALVILVLNTLILDLFIQVLGINKYVSKIITELILFILSYITQKNVIFKKEVINE